MNQTVIYLREAALDVWEFRRVLIASGTRSDPGDDETRLREIPAGAALIVATRLDEEAHTLVGVARCITDVSWIGYASGLAVSWTARGLGARRHRLL